jgi:dephospho-CoA kinase
MSFGMKPKSSASKKSSKESEVWGLTGGIASGKSLAASFFAQEGVPVLDADEIARELSSPDGLAHAKILEAFGTDDRAALRNQVFGDPIQLNLLESILHPLIIQESQHRTQSFFDQGAKLVIYEATLLVETGRYKDFDGLIVIDCPREIRKKRLISRNSFTSELAEQILNAQIQDDIRRQAATETLENSGSPDELHKKVRQFLVARSFVTS